MFHCILCSKTEWILSVLFWSIQGNAYNVHIFACSRFEDFEAMLIIVHYCLVQNHNPVYLALIHFDDVSYYVLNVEISWIVNNNILWGLLDWDEFNFSMLSWFEINWDELSWDHQLNIPYSHFASGLNGFWPIIKKINWVWTSVCIC